MEPNFCLNVELAPVVASTKEGKTHQQVTDAWLEFDSFEWEPPESSLQGLYGPCAHCGLLRPHKLLEQVNQLQRELGKAEGKLRQDPRGS
jgi:hypothetical protein